MAASWPSAKKTFSAVVDGITKLVALLFNAGYDEIEAMQTWLGAPNNAQTKLAALNRLFKYLNPVISVTWIDDDTVEIAATALAMFNGNDYVFKEKTSALQITLSGDLDTGAEAAETVYYIYLCGNSADSIYTAVFSASASAPTGYTYYKKIAKIYNNVSSNIDKTIQILTKDTFGTPVAKNSDTVYEAAEDGFITLGMNSGNFYGHFYVEQGDATPDTVRTQVCSDSTSGYFGGICPVRKGEYWQFADEGGTVTNLFWIPIGA